MVNKYRVENEPNNLALIHIVNDTLYRSNITSRVDMAEMLIKWFKENEIPIEIYRVGLAWKYNIGDLPIISDQFLADTIFLIIINGGIYEVEINESLTKYNVKFRLAKMLGGRSGSLYIITYLDNIIYPSI